MAARVIAVVILVAQDALASPGTGAPDSLALALDTADLVQEEYRQDLAIAVGHAQRQVAAASPGPARALALTLEARIRRLRGEYRAADGCLEQAEREPAVDPMTRARILVERSWNELDRFRTPWGDFNPTTDDVACVRPSFGQAYEAWSKVTREAIREAIDAIQDADPVRRGTLMNRVRAVSERSSLARSAAQQRELVTGAPTSSIDTSLRDQLLHHGLQVIDDELAYAQTLDPLPADRAALLRARLAVPLLTLARKPGGAGAYLACGQPAQQVRVSDPRLDGQELLLCAELALFPLATPETLGRRPVAPTSEDSTYRIANDAWSADELASKGSQAARDGLPLLDQSERRFRAAGNRRGMARAAFVRGAAALASAIDSARPAVEPLKDAIALAQAAGDRVLAQRGQVLLAVTQALMRNRADAIGTLNGVLDDIRQNQSFGAGLGAARIVASLAAHAAFVQVEPSSAELLNELAMDLYAAAGVVGESTRLHRRQALIQASVGRLLAARTTLAGALTRPRVCSRGNVIDGLLAEIDLRDQLASLALDSSDAGALGREIAAIEAALRRLAPDMPLDVSSAQVIARGLADQQRSDQTVQALRQRAAATRDPIERRRLEDEERAESRRGANRLRAIMTILGQRVQLDAWRMMLQHARDRAAIVEDPDMPPSQYYLNAERRARASESNGAFFRALLAAKRGDSARARAIWLAEVPKPSTQLGGSGGRVLVSAGIAEREVRRNALSLSTSHADGLVLIGVHDLADQALQVMERDFGPAWYQEMQQPWTGMSIYVAVASGLARHDQALAMARRMLDTIDGRRASLFDERFRQSMLDVTSSSSVYGRAVEAAARATRPREAMEMMERGKARSLQDRYAGERAPAQRRLHELAQAVELLQSLVDAGGTASGAGMARMKAELTRRRAEWDAEQRAVGLDAGMPSDLRSVADRVSRRLPSGTVVLDYFATSSSVTVVALGADREPILATAQVPGPVLEGLVRRLDSNLARRVRPDQVQGDAARLADIVFPPGPVQQLVASPDTRELVIVPHGVLHEIPFALLPAGGAPLVAHVTVRAVPFADAILAERSAPATPRAARAAVFWHLGDDDRVPLLHAETEARDIAALYQVRADAAPSRASVLAAMRTAQVVHLIAHGAASRTATGYARIDLPARSPADDGDLTVSDILLASSPLSADTVVMSSCEMANGRRTPGDDGTGVARALLQKGVGTIIAPVWQIVDVAQDVMRDLHRGLQRGEPPAAALANAQRRALALGRHPAFWAGFVVIGGNP